MTMLKCHTISHTKAYVVLLAFFEYWISVVRMWLFLWPMNNPNVFKVVSPKVRKEVHAGLDL